MPKQKHNKSCTDDRNYLIVFALASPIGVDEEKVVKKIKSYLRSKSYQSSEIHLSKVVADIYELESKSEEYNQNNDDLGLNRKDKFQSINAQKAIDKINQGNYINDKVSKCLPDIDAQKKQSRHIAHALATIEVIEKEIENNENIAFIIKSIKRPDELSLLRHIFGNCFFMFGLFSTKENRTNYLCKQKKISSSEAATIIDIDEKQKASCGQKMSDVFPYADAFIDMDSNDWKKQIERVLDLVFGHPYITPTPDEFAMNIAYQASLRSADLSRQVGASIFSDCHDLLSVGCNEVPCFGGGQYWDDDENDQRDFQLGYDPNKKKIKEIKNNILQDVEKEMASCFEDKSTSEKLEKLIDKNLKDITEYGRIVHAEMEAIISANRVGVTVKGATLYCTTQPCHNCAKHIINTGIKYVVYIEPYPKSLTDSLYKDSTLDCARNEIQFRKNKVCFSPFVGIAPRRFENLFKKKITDNHDIKRKNKDHACFNWGDDDCSPRLKISCLRSMEGLKQQLKKYKNILDDIKKRLQ